MAQPSWIPSDQWAFLVDQAAQYHTYPEVFAAIGWWETHWGAVGAGRQGYILGVGVPSAGPEQSAYQGLAAQIAWTAPRAGRVIDQHANYASFLAYARTIQRPTDPVAWAQGVWAVYQQIGGPTSGASPTQPAAPATSGTGVPGVPPVVWIGLAAVAVGVMAIAVRDVI